MAGFASKLRTGSSLKNILGTAMGMQTSLANQGTGDTYPSPNPETKKPGFHSADASADKQVRGEGSPRAQAIRERLKERRARKKSARMDRRVARQQEKK